VRFGPVPLAAAEGAIAAHTVSAGGETVKKGTRLDAAVLARLAAAGLEEIVVARLDPDDVGEDEAAARLAARLAGRNVVAERAFTGRANLHATASGVLTLDRVAIDRLNAVDEAVTLATLPQNAVVEAGRMVATVKIIPYAVPGETLGRAEAAVADARIAVAPFRLKTIGLVQTVVAGTPAKMLDKTERVTAARLEAMGAHLLADRPRVPHAPAALAEAIARLRGEGAELVLVFGASAIADRRDVIPEALERAGGSVVHFGMPVDPGNLLLLGDLGGAPVLGAPGCARSPRENGFDWILARLIAGLPVERRDITALGVGGLLMEIVSRPQPREPESAPASPPRVAGLLLAAGRSTRFGGPNKLIEDIAGTPVVRRSAEALVAAGLDPVVVVTGHMAPAIEAALSGLPLHFVANPDYADGLSTSLRAGVRALPKGVDGAVVALGDMPGVDAALVRALVAAFDPGGGRLIVAPVTGGRRGNPVLWGRRFFADLTAVEGDVGARHLLGANTDVLVEVPVDGEGALMDVDTPEALAAARRALDGAGKL
jgi:molybdenum cofactor cytidylyltransferase